MSTILEMTNKKLEAYLDSNPEKSVDNRYLNYFTLHEVRGFIGLMILTGVFRASREPIDDLYSNDLNFGRPIFRAAMPRERFKNILRFLRFDDHTTRVERVLIDKLAPIREIFESVNKVFHDAYKPGKYVTIDESMCKYHGRCQFLQYIPSKPDKYGLKIWVLADARNYYPLNLEVYTGKNNSLSNKPEEMTIRLVSKLNPGHVVVGDNLFSSLALAKRLREEKGLFYLGTVKSIRREIPRSLKNPKGLPLYSTNFYFSGETTLVSYIRNKNKNVLLISTIHHAEDISSTPKRKPVAILDYNANKSGVDKLDQLMKEYRPYRATRRWPCVIFFSLIAFSTQASWVLFNLKYPNHILTTTKDRKKFLYLLSLQLLSPLIKMRKDSPNFRFLTTDVKDTIDNLCNPPNTKIKVNKSMASIADSEISLPSASIPEPEISLPSASIADPGFSLPSVSIPELEISLPSVSIPDPEFSVPTASIPNPGIPILPADYSSTNNSKFARIGRCFYCKRKNDKKTRKICEFCFTFICPNHSKTFYSCVECQDKVCFT